MLRKTPGPNVLAASTAVLLLAATTQLADARFTVDERASTITVTQTDEEPLLVARNPGGELVIGDGVSIVAYRATRNLVVRGSTALTTSFVNVVLNEPLAGSLTLDLPGASDVTIEGPSAVIGGSLKVTGSDQAGQTVRLGATGQLITIEGSTKIDLRDLEDWVEFRGPAKILGSLQAKGVNHLFAQKGLDVGGRVSIDATRESLGVDVRAEQIFVGGSFVLRSGPGFDYVSLNGGGAIDGSATFASGEGGCRIYAYVPIFGKVTARLGGGALNEFYPSFVKGTVDVESFAGRNHLELRSPIQGRSVKYTGGAGSDWLLLQSDASRAVATIELGAGDDEVSLDRLKLARLHLDLGEGSDRLTMRDFVPPPGSTIEGLP